MTTVAINSSPDRPAPAFSFSHKLAMVACAAWLTPGIILGILALTLSFTNEISAAGNRSDGIFWLGVGAVPLVALASWLKQKTYLFWTLTLIFTIIATALGMMRWTALT